MSRHLLTVALSLLAAVVLSASGAVVANTGGGTPSSDTPTLFTVQSGTPQVLAEGAQKSWPVTLSESRAFDAIFKGGMWLPDPAGGRVYAKYDHHILHDNGDWTWVGRIATAHGMQSAVITFGKDAVFGVIPQTNGYPLRLVTRGGYTLLVQTDASRLRASPTALALRARQDFKLPPRHKAVAQAHPQSSAQPRSSAQTQASGNTMIDVMVAYTPGFVTETGGASAALTRINNLVDIANQAYADSQVNQSIRLVHTVEVNYPDDTSNDSALDDLTGSDGTNPVQVPASLQGIAPLRIQYGADLVSMLRSFDNATNDGCGEGWLVGGGEQQIVPSQDNAFGYSVVSDGSDAGFFCLDNTFAHELGHNMGDAHDRANATGPGAYPYSYGYKSPTTTGFSTIMAYGGPEQIPLDVFSNPNISTCQGEPCGVPDNSSDSADNAHSMNNTSSLIAQFEPTEVGATIHNVHNDINGDGKSDILFDNPTSNGFVYWIMNGARFVSFRGFSPGAGYTPVGTGDLNGDGSADILWSDGTNLYAWLSDGSGGFSSSTVAAFPSGGWKIIGTGDVNGDGKADILWYNPGSNQFIYWLMNGGTILNFHEINVTPGFTAIGPGDFNGDGLTDVAWVDKAFHVYIWIGNGVGFTQSQTNANFDSRWAPVGIGDVNGDGRSDILWFQSSSGNVQYWLMNSSTVVGFKIFNTGTGYTFAGVGDFDGDGQADILWTHSNILSMWLHYDPYDYYGATVQPYASGWNVMP